MDINAPNISFGSTFSLNIIIDAGIISIGEREVMVDTIPVAVYWTAIREKDTPTNGPKKAPMDISPIALRFLKAPLSSGHFFWSVINMVNPTIAAISLIWVAANGL